MANIYTDAKGQYMQILVKNLTELPIFSVAAEFAEPESSKTDFVEYPEDVFLRIERNVLQPNSNWFCAKKYISDTVHKNIRIVFRIFWRMDSYIGEAKFEKGPSGDYNRISLDYFYKRALYKEEQLVELARSEEKKLRPPLPNH